MSRIVFIHAADLHLDSPFSGLKNVPAFIIERLKESSFRAFQKMIDTAIIQRVEFLLLAGDIYDGENRSLRTQVRFRKEMERLMEHNIPVYMIHGNHDHLGGTWMHVRLPENVHVFEAVPEVKRFEKSDGTTVNIYGYSYPKRHVAERIITQFQKQNDADYHIGLLHGNLEGHTDHSPYAPFSQTELIEKDFDYWALGHIHKRQVIMEHPPAIYPGNIQGRNRKETGVKGFYLVTMENSSADYTFMEAGSICWDTVRIKIGADWHFDDILNGCRDGLKEIQTDEKAYLLEFVFDIEQHRNPSLFTDEFIDGILESIQEEEVTHEDFIWTYRIKVVNGSLTDGQSLPENPFLKELFNLAADFNDFDKALDQLYKHREARKYLDPLDEDEFAELLRESQRLISHFFHQS